MRETQTLINDINNCISEVEREITDGTLVLSPELVREYCCAIGKLEALNTIKDFIQKYEDKEDGEE